MGRRPPLLLQTLLVGLLAGCSGTPQPGGRPRPRPRTRPAPSVLLVQDGRAMAVVVLPQRATPQQRAAARALVEHVHEMSGVRLRVVKSDARLAAGGHGLSWREGGPGTSPRNAVVVGDRTVAARLGIHWKVASGTVLVRTYPGGIVVLGAPSDQAPQASFNAMTVLLERGLDIHYLWPGQQGKVVPRRSRVEVRGLRIQHTPPIIQRRMRWLSNRGPRTRVGLGRLGVSQAEYQRIRARAGRTHSFDGGWLAFNRANGDLRVGSGHAFGSYWQRFGVSHPEWFALQPKGGRDQSLSPRRSRLCVSNRQLIAQVAKDKISELRKSPGLKGVSIDPNDGGRTTFCQCTACRALDIPGARKVRFRYRWLDRGRRRDGSFISGALTDRFVWFWNRVAQRVARVFPHKLLIVSAYSVFSAPPLRRRLHPNLLVRFVPMTYVDDRRRRRALADLAQWRRFAKRIYFRPNFLGERRRATLLLYGRRFAADLRLLRAAGLTGVDLDSILHNWSTQGLNYYLIAKLLWNPRDSVDRLRRQYCRAGFGRGAKLVCRYFLEIESITDGLARRPGELTAPYNDPNTLRRLRGTLAAARAKIRDPSAAARLEFLREGLEFTALQARAHWFVRNRTRLGHFNESFPTLDQKLREMQRLLRRQPFAVNTAYLAWGELGHFGKLNWNWRRVLKTQKTPVPR